MCASAQLFFGPRCLFKPTRIRVRINFYVLPKKEEAQDRERKDTDGAVEHHPYEALSKRLMCDFTGETRSI